jgi:branched-chain amino acid aminotransferase
MAIEIAKSLNYEIIEKSISPKELSDFEGAFFTGTAAEVTPISKIVTENNEEIIFDISSGIDIKNKFFEIISENNEDKEGNFSLI